MRKELYHHGIKGMKWGVRRYQNKDGTLTNAGRIRMGLSPTNEVPTSEQAKMEEKLNSASIHNFAYTQAMADAGNISKGLNAGGSASRTGSNFARRSANRARDRYAQSLDLTGMTDKELQQEVTRLNLERNYRQLKASSIRTGRDTVAEYLEDFGDILVIGSSAATIVLTIYALKRGMIPIP